MISRLITTAIVFAAAINAGEYEARTRRLGEDHPYSEVSYDDRVHDVCDAIFTEAMKQDGQFMTRRILEDRDIDQLCADTGRTDKWLTDCRFYLHVIDENMHYGELAQVLQMEGVANVTQKEAYQSCGRIVNNMNQKIENGDVDGVRIVGGEDGDYFELEEVPSKVDKLVTFGAALSMMLGTTLVKVCRSFDRVTGHLLN